MAATGSVESIARPADPAVCGGTGGACCGSCEVRPFSVCAALAPGEAWQLARLAQPACVASRGTLFHQGDPAESVYNVTSGVVRLYRLSRDGRRQIVAFVLPGDFLGLALADRYGYSADAVGEVTACRFSREAFAAFLEEKPHLLRRLHEAATHELSLAQDQMVLLGRRTAEERVAAFLMSMRERWGRIRGLSVTVPLPMGRQDIADHLGLTIETVSRTVARLAREKALLVVPDGVRLLDIARLQRLAEG